MTRPRPHLVPACALVALLGVVAASGCGSESGPPPQCRTDNQCGSGSACVVNSCIPVVSPLASWSIELAPRSDSKAAMTEFDRMAFGSGPLSLVADQKVTLAALLQLPLGMSLQTTGHVVVTAPATIPGRPDLQFETELTPVSVIDALVPGFSVLVPQSVLGRVGSVSVTPAPPDDKVWPPLTFGVTLAAELGLPVPSRSFTITGNLYDQLSIGQRDYSARAFLDGGTRLLSNVDVTDISGKFTLRIPLTPDLTAAPPPSLAVELKPRDGSQNKPRFLSRRFALTGDFTFDNIFLPTFTESNVFRFNLRGEGPNGPAVGRAVVRAHTVLGTDSKGTTDFFQDALAGASGVADLALLPGTAAAARVYDIAIVPPAGSRYSFVCLASFPVLSGGNADAPATVPAVVLPRRKQLKGTVLDASGQALAGVSIVATPLADAGNPCADFAGPTPPTATTDEDGKFTLLLDPGAYRFDYDPPAGSPVPRLTEPSVQVSGDGSRTVQMRAGALVRGVALGADGSTPLGSAGIRIYQPLCSNATQCSGTMRIDPVLLGQTRAGADGTFSVIVPLGGN